MCVEGATKLRSIPGNGGSGIGESRGVAISRIDLEEEDLLAISGKARRGDPLAEHRAMYENDK